MPVAAADVDRFQGAGVGLETGCQDDDVKLVQVLGRLNAGLGDLLDRLAVLDVNELHVIAVKCLVVTMVQRRALGKERVALGREQLDQLRIIHFLSDLAGDEVRGHLIGLGAAQQVIECFKYPAEATFPVFFKDALHFLWRSIHRIASRRLLKGHTKHVVARFGNNLVVVIFDLFFPFRRHVLLHGRQYKVGCALEHRDLCRGFRDLGQHLYRRGARANNADALARYVEAFWPSGRMENVTVKSVLP